MTCLTKYASGWEYAAFWCNPPLYGLDNSGGAGNAFLTDTLRDPGFATAGIRTNVGMVLYNLTTGLSGPVTAVTETTITATGVTWSNGNQYRISILDRNEIYIMESRLTVVAGNINAALAANGQCDCTMSDWALEYLKKLNIVEASALYGCPCDQPGFTPEVRRDYFRWANDQLKLLYQGVLDVCGMTGANFPAVGWAEHTTTEFATEQIIINTWKRDAA